MKLVLHGALAAEYGSEFTLFTKTVPEAVRLLAAQLPGFRRKIAEGFYRVVLGSPETGTDLTEETIQMRVSSEAHLIPVARGAGGGGVKAVLGGVLLVTAIIMSGGTLAAPLAGMAGTAFSVGGMAVTWGSVAMFGFAMAAGGVAMMMAPQVNSDYGSREEDKPSFIFNGAINTTEQGTVIPVVYGTHMVGSKAVSAGLYVEQMPLETNAPLPAQADTSDPVESDPGGWTSEYAGGDGPGSTSAGAGDAGTNGSAGDATNGDTA